MKDNQVPRVLLVAPSLRIMGGQAVVAKQLLEDMRSDGIGIDFQPINPQLPAPLHPVERVKYLRTLVVSFFYIAQLLRRVPKYDVIHIFSASYFSFIVSQTPAILIASMYGKRIVLNYHSGQCEDHLNRWGRIVYAILSRVDQIVVQSEFLVDAFAKHGFQAVPIPNVVDTTAFPFQTRDSVQPKILIPRMLEPLYNVECAIRAFHIVKRHIPKAAMTILGDGSQRNHLHQLVKNLDLPEVTFAGRVERESMAGFYKSHDLCLNTSSIDNMPVSILEAFAAGLPVVTTAAGGIPHMVRDRDTGHLVPIDDHEAVARRIIEVCENPIKTKEIAENARKEIDKYCWDAVADKWYCLYRRLAPSPNGCPRKYECAS